MQNDIRTEQRDHGRIARSNNGTIVRVNPEGLAFLEDNSGRKYSFTFDKILGYAGESPEELGLVRGATVNFMRDGEQITEVDLLGPTTHRLLTVPEVARILRTSERLVYGMIKRRELPHVRVGRLMRIPKDAIEQLLRPTTER
jgi:excisionase family DNA binding protein